MIYCVLKHFRAIQIFSSSLATDLVMLHEANILLGRQDRKKAKEVFKVLGPTSENLVYSVEAFLKPAPSGLNLSSSSSKFEKQSVFFEKI